MGNIARNHHYIPQFYLRKFSDGGNKDSKIVVLDLVAKREFRTSARNIAGRRDFNRVEVDGVAPDVLENNWAKFEGECASAFRSIEATKTFEGENRDYVLQLIALLATRNPMMRENMGNFQRRILEQVLELSLSSKDRWEYSMRGAFPDHAPDASYEEVKAFFDSKQYKIEIPVETHLHHEMHVMETVADLLGERKWMLVMCDSHEDFFITSDHPVLLTWNEPETIPAFYRRSPGFGMLTTRVFFALGPKMALLGTFEDDDGVFAAPRELVASYNSMMILSANKQAYAPKLAFPFVDSNGKLEYGNRYWAVRAENELKAKNKSCE